MIDNGIIRLLAEWAAHTDAVAALWLFGSRAKGTRGQTAIMISQSNCD